jgi:biotin transport system substrate-specific component
VIYLFGVGWLMVSLQTDLTDALVKGLVPFVVGDLLKVALAGTLLPAVWKLVGER